jgi:hypothetical protein
MVVLQVLSVCGDCFELTGPANTTVAFFDFGANTTTTYQLQLTWDAAYLGPLTLDLVPSVRYAPLVFKAVHPILPGSIYA